MLTVSYSRGWWFVLKHYRSSKCCFKEEINVAVVWEILTLLSLQTLCIQIVALLQTFIPVTITNRRIRVSASCCLYTMFAWCWSKWCLVKIDLKANKSITMMATHRIEEYEKTIACPIQYHQQYDHYSYRSVHLLNHKDLLFPTIGKLCHMNFTLFKFN